MAGINRLGKAPPKPGTLRPPDPNKYRTVDMFSQGAEGDMEYLKMVRDIEDMQQQQGWLFGRGAFDKADLLYLRDQAEQQRHMELELRDTERTQFAALRSRTEPQESVRQSQTRPAAREGLNSTRSGQRSLPVPPKVKAVRRSDATAEVQPLELPETKRVKVEPQELNSSKQGEPHGSSSGQDGSITDKANEVAAKPSFVPPSTVEQSTSSTSALEENKPDDQNLFLGSLVNYDSE